MFRSRQVYIIKKRSGATSAPQEEHEALQDARQRQTSDPFKEAYKIRAGSESVICLGVRTFGLRRSRYIGLAKTRLQHILTAAAMNLTRTVAWLSDRYIIKNLSI